MGGLGWGVGYTEWQSQLNLRSALPILILLCHAGQSNLTNKCRGYFVYVPSAYQSLNDSRLYSALRLGNVRVGIELIRYVHWTQLVQVNLT